VSRAASGIEDAALDSVSPSPDTRPVDSIHLPDVAEQLGVLDGTRGVSVSDARIAPGVVRHGSPA
jgi:hypothetical protein